MADIRPFRSLRFNPKKISDFSAVISPPYDVIPSKLQQELERRHPCNAIHFILASRAEAAAKKFEDCRKDETLVFDDTPSFYLLEETFQWNGAPRTRRGLVCTIRLQDFGTGSIYPHERTMAAPVEDRLKLLAATQTHLSPVYMLCEDPDDSYSKALAQAATEPPLLQLKNRDDEISHRFWRITDPGLVDAFCNIVRPHSVLIADGHHRYTTALRYAREAGRDQEEAQWMLAYIAPSHDPGVVLSAIHQFYPSTRFDCPPTLKVREADATWKAFEESGAPLTIVDGSRDKILLVNPENHSSAVPSLLLSELIVKPCLRIDVSRPEDQKKVVYFKSPEEVLERVRKEGGVGFWLKPMTVAEVLKIARAGQVVPQKSTYFYPKVMTGFAFHALEQ